MSKSAAGRYRRKVSGVERYSMVINEIHRYNVDGIVVGCGTLDVDTLQHAVAAAADVNPGVRVRLKSFLGFSHWVDSGIAPQVKVVHVPHWDFFSDQGADFLQERFDPISGGPIADVVLVHANNRMAVVFRSLHAAMDGRSVAYWMAEVFRALRGEALIGAKSTLTDFDVAASYRKKIVTPEAAIGIGCIPVVPPSHERNHEMSYIWRAISIPRNVSNILPRAAVFLAQYARRAGAGTVGFTVPIDYRGLRVEACSNGNLTGYVRVHVGPDDTPRTVMQQLNQHIRDYADCNLPLQAKPLRWIPIKFMVNKLRKNSDLLLHTVNNELPSGGLVSMGSWDPMAYSTADFTAEFMLGIPGAVGKLNMVTVNMPHSTIVTFAAPKSYNQNGQIDRLTQDFAQAFTA